MSNEIELPAYAAVLVMSSAAVATTWNVFMVGSSASLGCREGVSLSAARLL
jgi:hypothetical protein